MQSNQTLDSQREERILSTQDYYKLYQITGYHIIGLAMPLVGHENETKFSKDNFRIGFNLEHMFNTNIIYKNKISEDLNDIKFLDIKLNLIPVQLVIEHIKNISDEEWKNMPYTPAKKEVLFNADIKTFLNYVIPVNLFTSFKNDIYYNRINNSFFDYI